MSLDIITKAVNYCLDFFHVPAVQDLIDLIPVHRQNGWEVPDLTFEQPAFLWWLVIVIPLMILVWRKRQPSVGHSRLPSGAISMTGFRTLVLLTFTTLSVGVAVSALIAARAHPQKLEVMAGDIAMVRDLQFAIDKSNGNTSEYIGSLAHQQDDKAIPEPPRGECGEQENWGPRKIDNEVFAVCKIAQAFPHDRKSLATFDGATQCCSPALNNDWRFFSQQIRHVNQQLGDNNTNFEDDTGVFQVMLDFISRKSTAASRVLLVATDGDGTLTQESVDKYAARIRRMNVTLICTGPGADTVATDPPSDALVKLCKSAGGIIVDTSTAVGIEQIIAKIRSLPPSEVKLESKATPRPVHEAFLLLAAIAWFLAGFGYASLGRIR
ncbi:MAG: VWA domain-containing protein [Candidatus Obscuribacterales bacterium]|nr:VWA domain-containing protein [Candidatus Obscuribacterales bacterium]